MSRHFPALVVIVPLLSAFLIIVASWMKRKLCFPIAVIALGISLASSLSLLAVVIKNKTVSYLMGGWAPPWGIVYEVDSFNGLILVVISTVAFLNIIATQKSVAQEFPDKSGLFYTLYVLFVTGLLGIVVTGDAFNLYVLLEIAALTGYALIGMGKDNAPLAGLNYIFIGTVGASFYLLGVGYLYLVTGSLNMADIAAILPNLQDSTVIPFAFAILMTGLFIKMALFPLHAWLPKAYSQAPSSAVSLIAPLTTKVMLYVMIRISLWVFTPLIVFERLAVGNTMVWVAVIAIVMGSLLALAQTHLRKMLSYIIVAEVGYMVGGFWLGNQAGITGAILHIVNDAAMTLCVFLAVGNILHKSGTDSIDGLSGMFGKMPLSMAGLVAGGLSIIGVPPTCGFFSKWYLINGAIAANQWEFVGALLFSSLINVVLFFRIIEQAYFRPGTGHHHETICNIDEAPASMVIPLLVVVILIIAIGLYSGDIVTHLIHPVIPTI